ncbi:MAG: hypothetical protein ACPGUE_08170 [Marinomonas sp.]
MKSVNKEFWYSFFDENPESDDVADAIKSVGSLSRFTRPDWSLILTPSLFTETEISKNTLELNTLFQLIKKLVLKLYDGDYYAFSNAVGFKNIKLQALFDSYAKRHLNVITPCRWDLIKSDSGLKVLELNAGGSLGGFAFDQVQKIYDDCFNKAQLETDRSLYNEVWAAPFDEIANFMIQKLTKLNNPLVLVIDDETMYQDSPLIANSISMALATKLQIQVKTIVHTDFEKSLDEHDGDVMTFEVFSMSHIAKAEDEYHGYFCAIDNDEITPTIDLLSELYMSKAMLALIADKNHFPLFSTDEVKAIESLVPETYLLENASELDLGNDWLLKPANGYGGQGVICKWETQNESWQQSLNNAKDMDSAFILQRRVNATQEKHIAMTARGDFVESTYPSVYGFFNINNQFAGGSVRQSLTASGVINASRNAAVGIVRHHKGS